MFCERLNGKCLFTGANVNYAFFMNFEEKILIALTLFLCFFFSVGNLGAKTNVWQPSSGHTQIPIWPGAVPDAKPVPGPESVATTEKLYAGKPVVMVNNVSQPTMTVYSPKGKNTGAAVVVFPGGGYRILAMDLEGTEVCDWLTSKGITGVLLKYRVPGSGPNFDWSIGRFVNPKPTMALQDAQRTLGLLRLNAAELNIDPHKIGVLGFSAGGYMVAAISTHFERAYSPIDAADKESCRPDFAVAIYPGHMSIAYKKDLSKLNPGIRVTSQTPPTFLLHAQDDPINPVEYSLLYYAALRKANVPVEMHLFTEGKHAFGLRRTKLPITRWPDLVETWLQTIWMTSENPEVRRLLEALSSGEWREREQAVEALWSMGLSARGAIAHLIERLADEEWQVRKAAATALSRMGPVPEQAIPSLIAALADEEWHVRKPAAEALAALGPASAPAVPALIEALGDEEWQVRKAAAEALAAIGRASEPAVSHLIEALDDEEWQVRSPAALALAAIGPPSKPALDRLIGALDDEEWKVRKHAAQALGSIGMSTKPALSALRQAVNDEEDQVRSAAAEALKKIADLSNKTD
jgi:HEAT repeat protein